MPAPFTAFLLLEFQVSHYRQRVAEARTIEERMFLKTELHRFKQALITFYN